MSNTTETAPTQPRIQTFYCPGCCEWHEAESLLEAVRVEAERTERENERNDDERRD